MMGGILLFTALAYVGLLFAIAYWGDKRADAGRSLINNPYVYALSLAVYCTAWTFYGSVGRAASSGIGFLPIYLGPTLMALLWVTVLRKIVRISKENRITTIADFISSRYGKSTVLSGLVTGIAVFGIIPYLSLQLKAVSTSFDLLWRAETGEKFQSPFFFAGDTALLFALLLAVFSILFGTRSLDATEHHEGMVLSIAFESIVKLLAFLLVGVFVTFFLFPNPGVIFQQAFTNADLRTLMQFGGGSATIPDWTWLMLLSMMAIIFLPRQFQMAVVENVDEKHLSKASWLFPLYLLLINIFVLPICFAGLMQNPSGDADFYVLSLPLQANQPLIALIVFIGGLSASTSMVIVETVALSTMVSNDLVMPILLRWRGFRLAEHDDFSQPLLMIRRVAILVLVLLSYAYFSFAGGVPLVSIGLISFAAVAQFAPALLGGIYWKRGTRTGAIVALLAGFAIWAYTLPLPSLVNIGGLPDSFIDTGPFGIGWLRPYALFGVEGLDPISHSLMWSMLANVGCYVLVSLVTSQGILERTQASRFVDVFALSHEIDKISLWKSPSQEAVTQLLRRFLGAERVALIVEDWRKRNPQESSSAFINYAEKHLAGALGAASAHILINTVVVQNNLTLDQVMNLLDETSSIIQYNREIEAKSQELAETSAELKIANERLRELDTMKSDFVSMVTHELRTPLTSIRAFAEILHDNPDLELAQRTEFLAIIQGETERLTRLINNVLDLSKIESGKAEWLLSEVDMRDVVRESLAAMQQLFHERQIKPEVILPSAVPLLRLDHDRIVQVLLNLLSNSIKFSNAEEGHVQLELTCDENSILVTVADNGMGVKEEEMDAIFERFYQATSRPKKQSGTGLGLSISKHIVEHFEGRLWVESVYGQGAKFCFNLPLQRMEQYG